MRALLAALFILIGSCPDAALAESACPRQPVPEPLDSARAPDSGFVIEMISFSVTPGFSYPQQAWLVRTYRETVFEQARRERVVLEVLRMQVEYDCNRHFVTGAWQGELPPERYAALRAEVRPFLEGLSEVLRDGRPRLDELVLDGTAVAVALEASEWQIRREGYDGLPGAGGEMSILFHALAAGLVPVDEMPEPGWQGRRADR